MPRKSATRAARTNRSNRRGRAKSNSGRNAKKQSGDSRARINQGVGALDQAVLEPDESPVE